MESSTVRVAPDLRPSCWDGGVRPALRWPSSVRSLNPCSAFRSADRITSGVSFLPPAVRALLDREAPAVDAASRWLCLSLLFFISRRLSGRLLFRLER